MNIKIAIPKAPLPPSELPPVVLPDVTLIQDQYPHIAGKIRLLWGSAALHNFLNDLIFDGRGDREGFPTAIAAALLRVHKENDKLVSDDHKNSWVKATF